MISLLEPNEGPEEQENGRGICHFTLRAVVLFALALIPAIVLAEIGLIAAIGWLILVGVFGATYAVFVKSISMKYRPEGRRPTALWPDSDIPPMPPCDR